MEHLRGRGVVAKEDLAVAVGSKVTSGTFRGTIGKLKGAGILRSPKDFHVELVEETPAVPDDDWPTVSKLIGKGAHPTAVRMVSYLVSEHRAGRSFVGRGSLARSVDLDHRSLEFADHLKTILALGYAEVAEHGSVKGYQASQEAIDHEPEASP